MAYTSLQSDLFILEVARPVLKAEEPSRKAEDRDQHVMIEELATETGRGYSEQWRNSLTFSGLVIDSMLLSFCLLSL